MQTIIKIPYMKLSTTITVITQEMEMNWDSIINTKSELITFQTHFNPWCGVNELL